MAQVTLTFYQPLNVNCQVGDTAHYVATSTSGEFTINSADIITIGQIREIVPWNGSQAVIHCESNIAAEAGGTWTRFILFSKNESVNLSSLLGYYASTKLVNSDTNRAELFSLGVEVFESSK